MIEEKLWEKQRVCSFMIVVVVDFYGVDIGVVVGIIIVVEHGHWWGRIKSHGGRGVVANMIDFWDVNEVKRATSQQQ